jgi:hypothetical protein
MEEIEITSVVLGGSHDLEFLLIAMNMHENELCTS